MFDLKVNVVQAAYKELLNIVHDTPNEALEVNNKMWL